MSAALPAIAGDWVLHGITLGPDGEPLYEWDADMAIAASGDAFRVAITTEGFKSSRSVSYAEKLSQLPSGEWHLRYGYEADPEHPASTERPFFGLSQLTFAPDLRSATGTSCNYNGRYVVVALSVIRKDAA